MMPAHAAITKASIEPFSNLFSALLEISNGLPPPLLPSDCFDFDAGTELVSLVDASS